jgi:hypothetical protein
MRKIRLKVQELAVESFDVPARGAAPRGTVRGMSDAEACATRWGFTCAGYGSCDPWMECEGTLVDNTCPGMNDC